MIKLTNVHKVFNSKGIAGINGLSLSLNKSEILGVMGINGSGKTTLLKLIAKLTPPDQGEILTPENVSLFYQLDEIPNINVMRFLIQNIHLNIDEEKKIQLARDMADIFEITFQLRQNLHELSAGQKQKVLLASVLINKPSVLLLDEPFTHLDPYTRIDILKSLFEVIKRQEMSVIWVTHHLKEAMLFTDRIALLDFGKIVQIDSPMNLVLNPKNLFVARFLGFENFLHIKKISNKWTTPWGTISNSIQNDLNEAYLVIPSSSWKITENNNGAKVVQKWISENEIKFSLLFENHTYHISSKRSWRDFKIGETIGIEPELENCFLIPL